MNKKQLLDLLEDVDDDTQIRLYTDHGQTLMKLSGAGHDHITEDKYMPDIVDEDELDE